MLLSKVNCRREEVICRRAVEGPTSPPQVLLSLPAPLSMASPTMTSKRPAAFETIATLAKDKSLQEYVHTQPTLSNQMPFSQRPGWW